DREPLLEIVVTPGPSDFDRGVRPEELRADALLGDNIDWPLVLRGRPKTDAEGRITFTNLIPGATYRIVAVVGGTGATKNQIQVEAGQTLHVPDIRLQKPDE